MMRYLSIAFLLMFLLSSVYAAPPPYCINQPGLKQCKEFCDKNPNEPFCKNFYPKDSGIVPLPKTCPQEGEPGYDPNCIDDSSAIKPVQTGAPDWQVINVLAILLAGILLAITYMIAIGFNMQELKFIATDELYQLLVTIAMLGLFGSILTFADELSKGLSPDAGLPLNENAILTVDKSIEYLNKINSNLLVASDSIGADSSQAAFCSFMGISVNLNSCGGFRTLLQPFSLAFQMLSAGIAELASLRTLLIFGEEWALILFLPFGIFLRCFQFTRPAGGFLIALAVALYLFLPFSVVFTDSLAEGFANSSEQKDKYAPLNLDSPISQYSCDPWDAEGEANINGAIGIFDDLVTNKLELYVFYFLVKSTLVTISGIMATFIGLRYLASAAGAEVDITPLAKLV